QIEDDQIRLEAHRDIQPALAIARRGDAVTFRREAVLQPAQHRRVVFDQKDGFHLVGTYRKTFAVMLSEAKHLLPFLCPVEVRSPTCPEMAGDSSLRPECQVFRY